MKLLLFITAAFLVANTYAVFLQKEEASQVLNRNKRANSGFEEFAEGNLERECFEEQCDYEEAHEVFEDDQQTEKFWQTVTNQCRSNPCSEPGTSSCVNIYHNFVCLCKPGFTGKTCEIEIDFCAEQPCVNGACFNDAPSYRCVCEPGYTGKHCNFDVDECKVNDNLCKNKGVCTNTDGSYNCHCAPGWTGKQCSQDVDECQESDPCHNSATCINLAGSYKCKCKPGWTGQTCSIDIDECSFGYCPYGSTCVDGHNSFSCLCADKGCENFQQESP